MEFSVIIVRQWITSALVGLVLPGSLLAPCLAHADDARLQQQRKIFVKAYPKARAGQLSAVDDNRQALLDYPLLPDLYAAWLRSRVGNGSDAEIANFLDTYPDIASARGLRHKWVTSLHKRKRWNQFLREYDRHYADTRDARLQCQALSARIATGRLTVMKEQALSLWMAGKSQPDDCDAAFDWLTREGHLSQALRRERLALAIDARNFDFARYLARQIGKREEALVNRWRSMRSDPAAQFKQRANQRDSAETREIVLYGMQRLATRDPEAALAVWPGISRRYHFSNDDRHFMDRRIAVSAARDHLGIAQGLLVNLDPQARDSSTEHWRIRAALREQDWPGVLEAINALPAEEGDEAGWRYWRARALEATGQPGAAEAWYRELAATRGYFNFLAADRLSLPYEFTHVPAIADEAVIAALQADPLLIRARELSLTNLRGYGRSEWDRAMTTMSKERQAQAAIVAHRWEWHSRAIKTGSSNGLMDDLELRYPLPWRQEFDHHAGRVNLSPTWAYGIARSESIFMPDVSSSAGALGLMQLMPATGRLTARQASRKYHGRQSLLDPPTNISLGTFYLDRMAARFNANQVLATAAYNAGPHRVVRWLPQNGSLPPDIWAETIPFTETRRYVRRVLEADAIFHWRLTGQQRRLASVMLPVDSPAATALAGAGSAGKQSGSR